MEDYKEKYEMALEGIQEILSSGQDSIKMPQLQLRLQGIFPELKESEDEKIRKAIICGMNALKEQKRERFADVPIAQCIAWLEKQSGKDKLIKELGEYKYKYTLEVLEKYINSMNNKNEERLRKTTIAFLKDFAEQGYENAVECIDWLEKRGESYTKKDIDDAYLKGISDAKDELEKQGTPAKLSEEEQNSFAKGVLSNCALSFINYLDAHSYEGKMCVSNGECEDIENAFHNAMWDKLHRYYCKYIEKQSEQKPILDFKAKNWYVSKVDGQIHDMTYNPTDMVEPKFKVGDWVVKGDTIAQILDIQEQYYVGLDINGKDFTSSRFLNDDKIHLWTIQDAKDGDVLACGDKVTDCPFIFHNLTEELNPRSYCGVNMLQHFQYNDENGGFWCHSDEVRPATKEQRELLFKKMEEAGYEWDDDKKDLKKVEDKTTWSEEDENYLQSAENACEYQYGKNTSTILWLKSLKDRVQPKQEWSEEDEKKRNLLISILKVNHPNGSFKVNPSNTLNMEAIHTEELVSWLKSLKDKIKEK